MSGVAGGNRIERGDVHNTFNKYVEEVLSKIPGFKKASLSGSVKAGSKADFGDLDIIVWFEGDDKREVKQRLIDAALALPQNIIVPFKSEKYTGRRYYNSGELISVLYPIVGKEDQYIQVDNIISLTEEEHVFKGSFLDLPAEKQGLLIGLAKVILLEENPEEVFRRMGISNVPKLEQGEEYEFNLSSVKLSLRKVKLEGFREVAREEVWSTTSWGTIKILFKNFSIDGSFEDLLDDIARRLTNARSKNRIAGIFKSMVSVKSGEVGTAKGQGKEDALEKVAQTLSEALDATACALAIRDCLIMSRRSTAAANCACWRSVAAALLAYCLAFLALVPPIKPIMPPITAPIGPATAIPCIAPETAPLACSPMTSSLQLGTYRLQ